MDFFRFSKRDRQDASRRFQMSLRLEVLETRNLLSPVNVLVNNTAEDRTSNDTQSETSLVVTPNGTVVGAFNDSEEYTGGATNHFTGWSTSSDGGATFTDHDALPASSNGDAGDPSLAVNNANGTVYFSTLSLSGSNRIQFYKSTNNGASFGAPVNSAPGYSSSHILDKEWITVDNFAGSGNGNIYQVLTDFGFYGYIDNGIKFNRSTDGGNTWSSGLSLGGSQGGNVVVGPDHSVYVFAWNSTSPEKITVRKSTNQGVSFGSAITVATLATTGSNGDLGLGFRTNAFPQAAVNPANGNIYVVYNDKGTGSDRANVYFTQSTNGGSTWSTPLKLNDDTTTNDQWQPAIAVTPDGAHVFVTWYDRRLDSANSLIDRYGVIGAVVGSTITWAPNGRITDTSFPAVYNQDPNINTTYMGDYDVAAADNLYFYTTWGDNRLADGSHAHQPDVRFAKISVTGILGPAGVFTPTTFTPGPTPPASQYPLGYEFGLYIPEFNDVGDLIVTNSSASSAQAKEHHGWLLQAEHHLQDGFWAEHGLNGLFTV